MTAGAGMGWERPEVGLAGALVAVIALALVAMRLARSGLGPGRTAALTAGRGAGLTILVLLLARPVSLRSEEPGARRTVALLVDRSRSMGLADEGDTRYRRALALGRELVPALKRQGFDVSTLLFDADAVASPLPAAGAEEAPRGERTALGRAIHHALVSSSPAPVAVMALTDGAANDREANPAALLSLVDTGAPFVGVGFGQEASVPSLNLQRASAPSRVAPHQAFRVTAYLQATGAVPAFDALLLRDGRVVQSRRVAAGSSSRYWSESFEVTEPAEGVHEYTVQLRPPSSGVVSARRRVGAAVRIGKEDEFRILYVQGALSWDFKFVERALRGDPTIQLTGLSRTSSHSVFRQNVESAGELGEGFPQEMAQIAPYRVVVLSDLKPADLTPAQQELVARFCGELGGGVLLLGGAATFDASWQGSRLESLLPVTFDPAPGVTGLDRPFHLRLTDEARSSPVFQVRSDGSSMQVWDALPTFTHYGRVLAEKPGAMVWARHGEDSGPRGRRVLMAVQPYGAGLSAVIAVQNLWRWRLAKHSDPATFDRFWQQLLRHLSQAGREDVAVQFLDQEIRVGSELHAVVERQPRPQANAAEAGTPHTIRVRNPRGEVVLEEKAILSPARPVGVAFRADREGVYTLSVHRPGGTIAGSESLEVANVDLEMERTGRDMENLRQWASVSQGLAVAEGDARAEALVRTLRARIEAGVRGRTRSHPIGLNGAVMAALLACLGAEWALRRRWGLT